MSSACRLSLQFTACISGQRPHLLDWPVPKNWKSMDDIPQRVSSFSHCASRVLGATTIARLQARSADS